RSPGTTQTDIAVRIHRESRDEVIAVRGVDEAFLPELAVAGTDLAPEDAGTGIGRALRAVAGEEATLVRIDASGPPRLVRSQLAARRRLGRLVLERRPVRTDVGLAQGDRLGFRDARRHPRPVDTVEIELGEGIAELAVEEDLGGVRGLARIEIGRGKAVDFE